MPCHAADSMTQRISNPRGRFNPAAVRPALGDRIEAAFPDAGLCPGTVIEVKPALSGIKFLFDDNARWWMNLDPEQRGNDWWPLVECHYCHQVICAVTTVVTTA